MSLNESITRELKERIGNLPDGARFATEAELCCEFGVSRMTINKIVTNLAEEGLLKRFPRRGTFVCRPGRNGHPEISGTIFEMRRNRPTFPPPRRSCQTVLVSGVLKFS